MLVAVWKENKVTCILFFGFILHVLSLFSPFSNKEVNNIFYIGVLFPVLLLTRWTHIKELLSSHIVKLAIIYAIFTSAIMAITLDAYKIKYAFYFIAFLLAFYHLNNSRLLEPKKIAFCLCVLVLLYSIVQLFVLYVIDGTPFSSRPWFLGWQIYTPSYFTAYISVAVATAGYYLFEQKSYILLLTLFILTLFLYVITQTRMGLLGSLSMLPFFFFLSYKKGVFILTFKSLSFLFVISLLVFLLYYFGFFDVLTSRGESYRVAIAKEILAHTVKCGTLLGCGYDYTYDFDIGFMVLVTEHSSYNNQLLHTGLFGLLLLLSVIISTIISGIKSKSPWLLAFVAGCGCLLVEGQSLMAQPRAFTQLIFWFPFCMVVLAELTHKSKLSLDNRATIFKS